MENAKITNAQALTAAVKLFDVVDDTTIAETCGIGYDQVATLVEKIGHMAEVANKPRKKNTEPTPAQRRAIAKAAEVETYILGAGKPVNWENISEHISGLLTSQKVASLMKKVLANGKVERQTIKGRVYYQAKAEE